jgi:hypothetical protein
MIRLLFLAHPSAAEASAQAPRVVIPRADVDFLVLIASTLSVIGLFSTTRRGRQNSSRWTTLYG